MNAFSSSFRSSWNGLTFVVNAIASTPGNPTFNWAAYADVAKILLDNTWTTGDEANASWVGVIKNATGAFIADMAIIPELVVVHGGPTPSPSPKLKTRLAKRDTYTIHGTSYRLVVARGTIRLAGLAKYVVDSVLLEPAFEGYTAILTNDQFREFDGPNVFSIVSHGGAVIDYNDMLDIVRTIYAVVDTYSSRNRLAGGGRRALVRNLQGQVIGAAGTFIATWSIGRVPPQQFAAASICPSVLVTQPDSDFALGCVRT